MNERKRETKKKREDARREKTQNEPRKYSVLEESVSVCLCLMYSKIMISQISFLSHFS